MSPKENSFSKIELLPLNELSVSPLNIRKHVGDLTDLENSIASMGLLQPIIVRPTKRKLEVVVGQRRFLACKALGWTRIPAVRRDMTDREALVLSLTENVQTDSIDPIDRANGSKQLIEDLEKEMPRAQSVEWVAKHLGKSPTTIYDWLRLLETTEGVKAMIREKKLDTSVGARLASLPEQAQEEVAEIIHEEYLPRPSALKVIERVREKLKEQPELKPREIIKEVIEEAEEYSVTVSLPGSLYKELSEFAQQKKVTIQEVIRRAVRKYLNL
ncbi:MAG: ParB/RepB/Spo0J family partition protein [Candidatus Bathyarchaeia archaeon]|nr:ParB/RepB/Spo0J family partition protein [Candidatus Bathyarchaeia archaeon]